MKIKIIQMKRVLSLQLMKKKILFQNNQRIRGLLKNRILLTKLKNNNHNNKNPAVLPIAISILQFKIPKMFHHQLMLVVVGMQKYLLIQKSFRTQLKILQSIIK